MNIPDSSFRISDAPELKISGDRDSGINDSHVSAAFDDTFNRERGRIEPGRSGVISLDFSEGVWQQAKSPNDNRFKTISDFGNGPGRGEVYYNKRGVLIVKEELKGRFIDWLV